MTKEQFFDEKLARGMEIARRLNLRPTYKELLSLGSVQLKLISGGKVGYVSLTTHQHSAVRAMEGAPGGLAEALKL
jgi:hypothetical protein